MTFKICIVSKDDEFKISSSDAGTFLFNHKGSDVIFKKNNSENLTKVYNDFITDSLDSEKKEFGYDFIVFLHSDVLINLEKLCNHVEECAGKYDVMGLCGCDKISVSESPLNWFTGSNKFRTSRWGCVCHGDDTSLVSFYNRDRPDITDHSVSCIDGLCIIISKKAVEKGLKFDERLAFDCYDTQISFDAVMNFNLELGCLVEPELKHFSVGKSIMEERFLDSELIVREKFGFGIPKGSRIEQYLAKKAAEQLKSEEA